MAIQYAAQIYDLSTMSRPDSVKVREEREGPSQALSPTMSYPQRIAALLAGAPKPPALRRRKKEVLAPLAAETRARLISVHTLNATLGGRG